MSDEFDYESAPGKNPQTLECLPEGEIGKLRAEIERLRSVLEEIAHHYIDSELASREKRNIARRALPDEQEEG